MNEQSSFSSIGWNTEKYSGEMLILGYFFGSQSLKAD